MNVTAAIKLHYAAKGKEVSEDLVILTKAIDAEFSKIDERLAPMEHPPISMPATDLPLGGLPHAAAQGDGDPLADQGPRLRGFAADDAHA